MAERGKFCYICGKKLDFASCVVVDMKIDRKDRKVHSRCKHRYERDFANK